MFFAWVAVFAAPDGFAQKLSELPPADARALSARATADWLLRPEQFVAKVTRGENDDEVVLENGLVRRAFKLRPKPVGFQLPAEDYQLPRPNRP